MCATDEAERKGGRPIGPAAVSLGLGVSTLVSYGGNFYAIGALADVIAEEFGVTLTTVFAFYSAAIACGGFAAPFAGRLLDRHGGGRVMAAGSATTALLLCAMALAPNAIAFALALFALHAVSTTVFYDAAFATAVRIVPDSARRTITGITLVAGFSSTVFWPLTLSLKSAGWDWRSIYLAYGALNLFVAAPIHVWLAHRASALPAVAHQTGSTASEGRIVDSAARRRAMRICAVAFAITGFVISGLNANLVHVLATTASPGVAALAGGLIGPAQVAGRLLEFTAGRGIAPAVVALAALVSMAFGLGGLAIGGGAAMAGVAAVAYGAGQGLTSIARGSLPLDLFGARDYALVLGRLNTAYLIAMAAAPALTAGLYEAAGRSGFFLALAVLSLLGAAAAARLTGASRSE